MSHENKRNLQYFETRSMRELFEKLENWQNENHKRFLSIDVQKDSDMFCCIALTNPSEVVITNETGFQSAGIINQRLRVIDV